MALEDTDKAFIAELITKSLGDFAKGDAFKGAINGTVASAVKGLKLDEKLAERDAKLKAIEDARKAAEDGGGEDKGKGKGDADSPELRKMRAEIEKLTQQTQKSEQARLQAEEARQTERLHGSTRDALAKVGVSSERIRHAMALLQADGRIAIDDTGAPVMKYTREWGEEALPLEKGLAEWVKTDDGKVYLPATGAQGTGGGAGKSGGAGPIKDSAEDILKHALRQI